jgi:hypothetical protein
MALSLGVTGVPRRLPCRPPGARRAATCLAAVLAVLVACSGPRNTRAGDSAPPSASAGPPPARRGDAAAERLRALPYAAWAPIAPEHAGKRGVVRHDPERATPGLNLYASPSRGEAWLVDMAGRVRHTWSSPAGQPAPGAPLLSFFFGWQHVLATPEAGLLAIVNRHRILRLDAASRSVWSAELPAHHELAPAPGGDVLTLVDAPRIVVVEGRRRLVLDDAVVRLDRDGRPRWRLSLWDALSADPAVAPRLEQAVSARYAAVDRAGIRRLLPGPGAAFPPADGPDPGAVAAWIAEPRLPPDTSRETLSRLRALPGSPPDALHANSVQLVTHAVPGVAEPGDLLVCIRELDLVAVVEPGSGRLRWSWGPGVLEAPHQPTLLPGGRLLVFDNGPRRGHSRVLELDPRGRRITWVYGEAPEEAFFSPTMGGCQPLPGGNLLVTDSLAGRAFEVARDKRIVWEFFVPALGSRGRATIYRMQRLTGELAERMSAGLRLDEDPS